MWRGFEWERGKEEKRAEQILHFCFCLSGWLGLNLWCGIQGGSKRGNQYQYFCSLTICLIAWMLVHPPFFITTFHYLSLFFFFLICLSDDHNVCTFIYLHMWWCRSAVCWLPTGMNMWFLTSVWLDAKIHIFWHFSLFWFLFIWLSVWMHLPR